MTSIVICVRGDAAAALEGEKEKGSEIAEDSLQNAADEAGKGGVAAGELLFHGNNSFCRDGRVDFFQRLLVGAVKMAGRVVREMMGL